MCLADSSPRQTPPGQTSTPGRHLPRPGIHRPRRPLQRTVRILLECFLVCTDLLSVIYKPQSSPTTFSHFSVYLFNRLFKKAKRAIVEKRGIVEMYYLDGFFTLVWYGLFFFLFFAVKSTSSQKSLVTAYIADNRQQDRCKMGISSPPPPPRCTLANPYLIWSSSHKFSVISHK